MNPVPDIIGTHLKILFVGFNPGLRSAITGYHFAGHSNRFWRLLAESGLTPRQLKPEESPELLSLGYGITNIVDRPSKAAAEITKAEYLEGGQNLKQKLAQFKPKIACYAGIGVYREFTAKKAVSCGLQADCFVPGVIDFVLPSPSGLNRTPFAEQLRWYCELRGLLALWDDA